jgi:cytidylate kinase
MSVITISREAYSGGTEMAMAIAKDLGYCYVDKQLIGELLSQYGLINFREVYDSAPSFWEEFNSEKIEQRGLVVRMMNKSILAIAKRGNAVIVGRGGYVTLDGYADVLNVLIRAPFDARVKDAQGNPSYADAKAAEKEVREKDRVRGFFLDSAFKVKSELASDFDLVINSDKVPAEEAIRVIEKSALALSGKTGVFGKLTSAIEVDSVLQAAVTEAFNA